MPAQPNYTPLVFSAGLPKSGNSIYYYQDMEAKAQHGYLILADISGYSTFVAESELEKLKVQESYAKIAQLIERGSQLDH